MLLLMVKFSPICYFSTVSCCVRYCTRQRGSCNKWDLAQVLHKITFNQRTQIMFQRNHLPSWNLELEKYVQHIEIINFFYLFKNTCVYLLDDTVLDSKTNDMLPTLRLFEPWWGDNRIKKSSSLWTILSTTVERALHKALWGERD